jgi:polyferredoxin
VLGAILIVTGLMLADAGGSAGNPAIKSAATQMDALYGFFVGAIFSGVAGTGLYPLMGTRVWCRFGCPMAAILGLFQKFGRFRITVKKDMCISCGNCSTYCEMGIDVRAYAMGNKDIKRASCVGCGMCAHVCPRGVLRLETRPDVGPHQHVQTWTVDL